MKEITTEERRIAAFVAASYPEGYGHKWGWGPLANRDAEEIVEILREQPRWAMRYG